MTIDKNKYDSIEILKLCLCSTISEFVAQSIYLSLKMLVDSRVAYKEVNDIRRCRRRCIGSCQHSKDSVINNLAHGWFDISKVIFVNQVIEQIFVSRTCFYSTSGPILCTHTEDFEIVRKSGDRESN